MKKTIVSMAAKLSVTALSAVLFIAPQADAATSIAKNLNNYTLGTPVNATVQAYAWFKPAFGNDGWTHFSSWGQINLKKGKTYQIEVQSTVPGLHPGVTVWHRLVGKKYAPLDFFYDHNYKQYISLEAKNLIDENPPGRTLGKIDMRHVVNGFDNDGMTGAPCSTVQCAWPSNPSMNGVSDGTPGRLLLTFKAKKSGWHQFVVGGINPDDKNEAAGGFSSNKTFHPVQIVIKRIK